MKNVYLEYFVIIINLFLNKLETGNESNKKDIYLNINLIKLWSARHEYIYIYIYIYKFIYIYLLIYTIYAV